MPDSQPPDAAGRGSPLDAAHVDEWIRVHIGRQILVGYTTDLPQSLLELITRYQEIRLAQLPPVTAREPELESALASLLALDPHALLFWLDPAAGDRELASRLYRICERTGALDACFVALVGPAMSRAVARALAFEDGFPWPGDASALIESLLAQAEAREEARRRGSSPPCYL